MGIVTQVVAAGDDQMAEHSATVWCDQCRTPGPTHREQGQAAYVATVAAGKAQKAHWVVAGHHPQIRALCPGCAVLDPQFVAPAGSAPEPAPDDNAAPVSAPPARATRRRRIRLAEPAGPTDAWCRDAGLTPTDRCPDTLELPGTEYRPGIVYQIPCALLARDPDQPRVEFEPAALEALAADLVASGQQSPIMFRLGPRNDGEAIVPQLYVVHGERRWRAAQLAGLSAVAGILDPQDDHPGHELPAERVLRQATDNDLHEPLSAWDWAYTIKRLTEPPHNMRVGEIAKELTRRGIPGKSHSVVSTFLSLHRLPVWGQLAIQSGALTRSHAKYILPHLDRPEIMDALGVWLAERVAQYIPAGTDLADCASKVDGSEPPRELTIPESIHADFDARPVSIPDLRYRIADLYKQHYMPLEGGKWFADPTAYVSARFDSAAECARCPQYAVVDGTERKASYCCDTTLVCFYAKNQAAARALDEAHAVAAIERQARGEPAGSGEAKRAQRARELEQERLERDAIKAAIKNLDDDEAAIDLLLYALTVADFRLEKDKRGKISIESLSTKRARKGTAAMLGPFIDDALGSRYYEPDIRRAVADYLGVETPADQETPA
jgi:ParB/RepB/Spo0J family partition protein